MEAFIDKHDKTVAHIGFIYVNRYKDILSRMCEVIQEKIKGLNINIICFQVPNLNLEYQCVKGTLITDHEIKETYTNIPPIIYNMGYFTNKSNKAKLKRLRIMKKTMIINPINRFNQLMLFDMVDAFDKHVLLPYKSFNEMNLQEYLSQFNQLFILPEKRSHKSRCIQVTREKDMIRVSMGQLEMKSTKDDLYLNLKELIEDKKYVLTGVNQDQIVQEIRLYLQRNGEGNWGITQVNNEKNELNHETIADVKVQALTICEYLEHYLNNTGSFTLDFIITKRNKIYLFYISGWDDQQYLINLNDQKYFWNYFNTALEYAIYLKKWVIMND